MRVVDCICWAWVGIVWTSVAFCLTYVVICYLMQ